MKEPGNARITLMFSAFEGTPRIVRLFGHGMCCHSMMVLRDILELMFARSCP